MDDLTEKYKDIILYGTIEEIREFNAKNFHKIKHGDSFYFLLVRLSNAEGTIEKIRNLID